jgi:Tfp pilus assembly protein PilF
MRRVGENRGRRDRAPGGPALPLRLAIMTAFSALTMLTAGCQLPIFPTSRVRPSTPRSDDPRVSQSGQKMSEELPSQEAARLQFAVADRQLKGGFDVEARARFEQSRRLDPSLKGVAHRLALIHDSQGEHTLAQAEYAKALAENPKDPGVLNDLGYSYYSQGDWKHAEETYRKALVFDKNPRSWNNLGLALAQQGRYREALSSFRNATDEARAEANLGFVFLTQGKLEHARRAYQHAIDLDPSYEVARHVLAQMNSNRPSSQIGQLDPAPTSQLRAQAPSRASSRQKVGRLPETVGAGGGPIVIGAPREEVPTTAAPATLEPAPLSPG